MRGWATDHHEVEWQFDALDVRPVADWLENRSRWGGPAVASRTDEKLSDTYLDTEDWRLYRAGYALRVRRVEEGKQPLEATMKSLDSVGASADGVSGLRRRREISARVESAEPGELVRAPGALGDHLRSLLGPARLRPIFAVNTHRSAYGLTLHGTRLGEVVLDETEIPLGDGEEPARLRRVEVELDANAEETTELERFVEGLRAECRLSPATSSKYEAGIFTHKLAPPGPPELGPTAVDETLTLGEAGFAVLRGQFSAFLAHEPGTRIGEDPEELHDMRVASRRMRAAMKIFAGALPRAFGELQEEVKWIAGALGEVRDLDVQLDQLETWISEADPEDREALGAIRGVLTQRREAARAGMLRALDSGRYSRLIETLTSLLGRGPEPDPPNAEKPVLAAAPALIRKLHKKVRKTGDRLEEGSPGEEYHELRKKAKRLRYALEFLADVYGKPAKNLVTALKALQDVLGDHQDAEVAIAHLRELSEGGGRDHELPPRAVFAMGAIAHRYEMQLGGLRAEFPKAYGEIKGRRWDKLAKTLDNLSPDTDAETS